MQKILTYDLSAKDGTFPDIPCLHDYNLSEILIAQNKIILTSEDFENHDYDYSDLVGFHPKKVSIELCFNDPKEEVDCNVYSLKYCAKKQFRDSNKFGYGAKVNCYAIEEFASFHKNYSMEFIENAVGCNKVIFKFSPAARQEIFMEFFCDCVKYAFND
ncbi:MAG: hypothetical protein K2O41_05430 [Clostridia bacterium]|nr:hypothetical protein [Clostridia bacterium]